MADNNALYNAGAECFRGFKLGSRVTLADGMIHKDGEGWIARFRNDEHALVELKKAGFVVVTSDGHARVLCKEGGGK